MKIASKTFRDMWPLLVIYVLVLEAILVPVILLWPDLYDTFQKSSILDKFMVADFMKRWSEGLTDKNPVVAYANFMAIEIFFRGVNICGIAAAVLLSTGIISRERENQTLEFLMSRPVSRSRLLWSKFWIIAVIVVAPIFLTSWSAIPWSWKIDEDLSFANVTTAAFHSSMFVVMFLTFTTLCSVICSTQLQTAATVGGVTIVQVAMYFTQQVRAGSIFRLSDYDIYSPVMLGNLDFVGLFFGYTQWMIYASLAMYVAADRLFQRANP